jgi:hypothetical protein
METHSRESYWPDDLVIPRLLSYNDCDYAYSDIERVEPETCCCGSKSVYRHYHLEFDNNKYLLFVQSVGPPVCAIDNCRIC